MGRMMIIPPPTRYCTAKETIKFSDPQLRVLRVLCSAYFRRNFICEQSSFARGDTGMVYRSVLKE